jgi:competence protein ComFB
MALRDRYDFESLVNVAETLVLRELEAQLGRLGALDATRSPSGGAGKGAAEAAPCACRDCVLDMAAYALNHVKPSYRVSLMGSFSTGSAEEAGYAKEISRVVREAIEKVRANPSHD